MLKEALKEKILSPQEVRAILNTDNKEIVELCKRASIMPRKNSKGHTYFSYEEVKNLRKVGMDEVVVELIRCKTDNETLRQKIVELNKEVYQLKNDMNSFRPLGMGLYIKSSKQTWE